MGYSLFDTAIGTCAIAWTDRGIRRVALPDETPDATRSRMRRHLASAAEQTPPASVRSVVQAIVSLLEGTHVDLTDVVLDDDDVPALHRRVYAITRSIAPGHTLTYGAIAKQLGDARLAQTVGYALGRNPFPIIVPCHRVLAAHGALGGFSAPGGVDTKRRMLEIEGALEALPADLFS
ncbi:MAG TPA: methylated-DNA--[protein]-cysteine S-methyltransferase [Gemmatimonadaceae bacterium]